MEMELKTLSLDIPLGNLVPDPELVAAPTQIPYILSAVAVGDAPICCALNRVCYDNRWVAKIWSHKVRYGLMPVLTVLEFKAQIYSRDWLPVTGMSVWLILTYNQHEPPSITRYHIRNAYIQGPSHCQTTVYLRTLYKAVSPNSFVYC